MGSLNFFRLFQVMAVIWVSSIPICSAEIRDTKIDSDSRPMILFEKFGFTHKGHVNISVFDVAFKATEPAADLDPADMGFLLLTDEGLVQVLIELEQEPHYCILKSDHIKLLFNFKELDSSNRYTNSFPITDPNEYSLFYANCRHQYQVSMNVHTEMYNMEVSGIKGSEIKDFLPAGQTQLPKLYYCFFLLYLVFLGFWIYECVKQKATLHRIHMLMCALLLLKALNLVCEAEDKSYVKRTGTAHGWDIAFYIFGFLKGIMLFTLIVLIGTGWSFLKPYLQEREKRVLMIVIPLQVFANIASIVIDETGPSTKDWFTWKQAFLLIDIICCCAIIFPIVWSIRSLREASKTDGKAAKNLAKLTLFRQFYIVVVSYLYFTRIVVFALTTVTDYKYKWVSSCADEAVTLAFYIFIFYKFRPVERNPYFVLDDEEEEAAQVILRDEEFEL
uniref:TSA: Wollemia nobilis Ref_Wollemi_Transcript_10101_1950 transcribed RNA sequence n=1 Tax=Wollemia nobilis TaxID=56998 RepID=A0A0C9QTU1_9CONI